MSEQKIRTFLFTDPDTNLVLFCKQSRGLNFYLNLISINCYEVAEGFFAKPPKPFEGKFHPDHGYKVLTKNEIIPSSLELSVEKIRVLCFLNTNVQLLVEVIEKRFTDDYKRSFQISVENLDLLNAFLYQEKQILLSRCHNKLAELNQQIMSLNSINEVQNFQKNYMDHTIIGDYSASNRGVNP